MGGRWPGRCRPLLLEGDTAEGNAEHFGAQIVNLVFFVFLLYIILIYCLLSLTDFLLKGFM